MSYLDAERGTAESIHDNEIALARSKEVSSFQLSYDYRWFVDTTYDAQCERAEKDGMKTQCGSYIGLCFVESSKIFKCDSDGKISVDSEVFTPPVNGLAEELGLIGDAFELPVRE